MENNIVGTRIAIVAAALLAFALIAVSGAKGQHYYEEGEQVENTILRGDVNGDGLICLDDPVFLIYHLFRDGRTLPCIAAADFDGSKCIDIGDVLYGLNYLFIGDVYLSGSVPESRCYMPPD